MESKIITQELKEKFNLNFVVIYRNRYWGLDFNKKGIKEISFDEAYGSDFFDWDNNICLADDNLKQRYDKEREENGCGWIGKIVAMAFKGHPLLEH